MLIRSRIEFAKAQGHLLIGGAISVDSSASQGVGKVSLIDSTIHASTAYGVTLDVAQGRVYGGAIAALGTSVIEAVNSVIDASEATAGNDAKGGAVSLHQKSSAEFKGCVIRGSKAQVATGTLIGQSSGGAFYVSSQASLVLSDHTTVTGSTALLKGGAIFGDGSILLSNRTSLTNNHASIGSTMWLGGGAALIATLPVPSAHWIAAVKCQVSRGSCSPIPDYDGSGPSPCATSSTYNLKYAQGCACFDFQGTPQSSCSLDTTASPTYQVAHHASLLSTCPSALSLLPNGLPSPLHLLSPPGDLPRCKFRLHVQASHSLPTMQLARQPSPPWQECHDGCTRRPGERLPFRVLSRPGRL